MRTLHRRKRCAMHGPEEQKVIASHRSPRRFVAAASFLCLFFATASADAGLVFNHDHRSYAVAFQRGGGSVEATVPAEHALAFRCRALPCRITMRATGQSIELTSNGEDVIIKAGRLRLRRAERTSTRN